MNSRLEKLKEMERQKPDDAFLKFAIAQEYVAMGNDDDALTYYNLVRERFPQYVPVYYQAGKLYERINKMILAADTYKQGIAVARAAGEIKTASELNEALMLLDDE